MKQHFQNIILLADKAVQTKEFSAYLQYKQLHLLSNWNVKKDI